MKHLKVMVTFLLTACLVLTMAGCGSKADETTKARETATASGTAAATQADQEPLQVAIVQLVDNGAFEDMREGFIEQLRKTYSEEQMTIDYKCAQGDATALNTICQEVVDSGADLVAAIATPSAQAMVNLESDIPVIFISVSNPVGAGIITDMEKPDKNCTGTSNAIPVSNIFELAKELTPDCKTFGLLYTTGEVNSVTTIEQAKEYLDGVGISYEEAVVSNSSEIQQAAQTLAGKCDAIFVPNDSVIQSGMAVVAEAARDAKIPVYGSSAVMVASGAFATVAISDQKIGAISADMAIQYLKGTPIAKIPAQVVPATDTVINQQTADLLGITFTDEVKNSAQFINDSAN